MGIVTTTSARRTSTTIIIRLRFTRSTHAPITKPNSRYGTNSAAAVIPRFTGEPVSLNTSRGSANSVNELPSWEMVCPTKNRQKSPDIRVERSLTWSLYVEQLLLDRVDHGLHPRVQMELVEDVPDVVLHGVLGDEQLVGDVLVVESLGHQPQDLELAVGELRRDALRVPATWAQCGELREQLRGHGRRDPGLPRPHRADGVGDLFDRDLLEEVAGGARLDGLVEVGFLVGHREHEDLHVGELLADLLGGLDPRATGHPDVHQHDVGLEAPGPLHGLGAVAGLPHHLDVGLAGEDHLEPTAEQGVVVNDEDPKRGAFSGSARSRASHRRRSSPPRM